MVGPADATIAVAPGGYFEVPYDSSARATLLWAAAGAGFARVTLYGFNPDQL
jgi:hypothetical protein